MIILLYLIIGIGSFVTILSCLYLTFGMIAMLGYKIYRKVKFGKSLYD